MAEIKAVSPEISKPRSNTGETTYRNNAYDEDLAKEMQDPEFAQQYLLNLVEDEDEPMTVEEALRLAIPRMGAAEYSRKIKKSKTDIDKFLRGEHNLKPETLNDYLVPFNLRIKVTLEKVA